MAGAGYLALAQIACEKQEYEEAFELIERSLVAQYRNYKARHLKSIILRKQERMAEAELWLEETLKLDPMDAGAMNELVAVYEEQELEDKSKRAEESLVQLLRDDPHNYIALAQDYADAGQYGDALNVFAAHRTPYGICRLSDGLLLPGQCSNEDEPGGRGIRLLPIGLGGRSVVLFPEFPA